MGRSRPEAEAGSPSVGVSPQDGGAETAPAPADVLAWHQMDRAAPRRQAAAGAPARLGGRRGGHDDVHG